MKKENTPKQNHIKGFAIFGIVMTILVGVIFAASGLSGGKLLSQFSGNGVTPATASSRWQPSVNNPHRAKVSVYSTRLDGIIVRILARGSNLTSREFISYVTNLTSGIITIGNKQEYANDQDIKNVVAYLTYELNDAKTSLSVGGAFFSDITNLIEGTGGNPETNTMTTVVNNTGTTLININTGSQENNASFSNTMITSTNQASTQNNSGSSQVDNQENTVQSSTSNSSTETFPGCTRNGISYIHGDVRCDGNQAVRCNNGSFIHIHSCGTGNLCVENPTRTSNNNFFTSCVREYDTYRKIDGYNNIQISETELATLKNYTDYKCKYNATLKNYGNCVYQSCVLGQSHEENGNCVLNTRECTLENSTNGGRQTWISGSGWSTCQTTSSTTCNTGYRLVNGVCTTGAATCNSSTITYGKDVTKAFGVEISNKTFLGYVGSGDNNWKYDETLSNACTWKCKEGFKKTTSIIGYRGTELCEVPDPVIKLTASKNPVNPGDVVTISWSVSDFYNDGNIKNQLGENVGGCHFREPAELSHWVAGIGDKNPRGVTGSVDYTTKMA